MSPHRKDMEASPQARKKSDMSFFGLGIAPRILEILERIKFTTPTPIQSKAIPPAIEGKDVIGIAQSGTGKTLAFAIPVVQHLAQEKGAGLVLAPTRELAMQIDETFRLFSDAFKIKTACLIGGAPMHSQTQSLRKNPRIVIATPGRLIDHMNRRNFMPGNVTMLVLDEADRMLDMGFKPQVEEILKNITKDRQTMLFSATMPVEIMQMINKHMRLPVHVEIAPPGTTAEGIAQELYIVKRETKIQLLGKVLSEQHGSVLLFIRTKHNARKIAKALCKMGHRATDIHSDKSLGQRRAALEGFKTGRYRILVATDVAARGIDVKQIEIVINYDLPDDIENYVHRIGRTGRAGEKGKAISFATPDQSRDVKNIETLIRMQLPVMKHPEIQAENFDRRTKSERPGGRHYKAQLLPRGKKTRNYSWKW